MDGIDRVDGMDGCRIYIDAPGAIFGLALKTRLRLLL